MLIYKNYKPLTKKANQEVEPRDMKFLSMPIFLTNPIVKIKLTSQIF